MFNLFCLGLPPINPINGKAQRLPVINPITSMHGRVFLFSWLSFMLSFMAWYAFPPLLSKTIKGDLHLTTEQVLNSNIVALCAGLCMRAICGPLCDRFGPRLVMVGILLVSSIPCGLAGTVTSVTGLYLIRFFVGISGAAFVPCQVWCMNWYDKNVVGTANAFAAGWGNAGAGVTYFVMPAVLDSLVHERNLAPHVAWRVAFIVPTILLIACGLGALLLCDDTPTGSWASRFEHASQITASMGQIEDGSLQRKLEAVADDKSSGKKSEITVARAEVNEAGADTPHPDRAPVIEVVIKPSFRETVPLLLVPQTLMLAAPYFCTFGGELAINLILSSHYMSHFGWTQTHAGRWAAMFGLVNVITRPAGGIASDTLYKYLGSKRGIHAKKYWYGFLCAMQGVFGLLLGLIDSKSPVTTIGLVLGMAIFMDAANGAAYGLLPHVSPQINGVLSGVVGASGNFGGTIFSIIFRFTGPGYARGLWIIGVFSLAVGCLICAIPPIPRAQRRAGGYMIQ